MYINWSIKTFQNTKLLSKIYYLYLNLYTSCVFYFIKCVYCISISRASLGSHCHNYHCEDALETQMIKKIMPGILGLCTTLSGLSVSYTGADGSCVTFAARISTLTATTKRSLKFLAIALNFLSKNVWTYLKDLIFDRKKEEINDKL